jgi:hypothetical protein
MGTSRTQYKVQTVPPLHKSVLAAVRGKLQVARTEPVQGNNTHVQTRWKTRRICHARLRSELGLPPGTKYEPSSLHVWAAHVLFRSTVCISF